MLSPASGSGVRGGDDVGSELGPEPGGVNTAKAWELVGVERVHLRRGRAGQTVGGAISES